jgi:hypothetical protein
MISSKLIQVRMKNFKAKSFEDLSALDDIQSEEKFIDGKKYTINIYKDLLNPQTMRIVIQVYQYRFLGMGYMLAEGFTLDKNGTIIDLRTDEIYDFI